MHEAKSVAIIGAGPVGLPAAHVLERGLRPIVLEAGDSIGHSVRQWGHVQLFSPWEYNIDRAAARLLAPTGWNSLDPHQYPTGAELLERYLEPLAGKTGLADHLHTSSRVTAISRAGFDKLKTRGREPRPSKTRTKPQTAERPKAPPYLLPPPAPPPPPLGEMQATDRIAYGMPDVLEEIARATLVRPSPCLARAIQRSAR